MCLKLLIEVLTIKNIFFFEVAIAYVMEGFSGKYNVMEDSTEVLISTPQSINGI